MLKHTSLGCSPSAVSAGLDGVWEEMGISYMFPGDVEAAGAYFENYWSTGQIAHYEVLSMVFTEWLYECVLSCDWLLVTP